MRGARSGSVNGEPGSIARCNRWNGSHRNLRERARRLHPPGPARAAFIARGGVPEAPAKPKRARKAKGGADA